MIRVIVESPYKGDVSLHLCYLRACMRDALLRGESPYASHALLTQPGVLRDELPDERELGIAAGFEWRGQAQLTAFYTDLGWSDGMQHALRHCCATAQPYTERRLSIRWHSELTERQTHAAARLDWLRSLRVRHEG